MIRKKRGSPGPSSLQYDALIDVKIAPDDTSDGEKHGLIIYIPLSCGKSYAQDTHCLRFIDTDYIYLPDCELISEKADIICRFQFST